jgi:RNA polymerase sigma-70 factor (ECF subfamily)
MEERRRRFESLTLPHLERLAQIAMRRTSRADAEDWVQETYLRAYRAFDQLREPERAFQWLCQILRSIGAERNRPRSRRAEGFHEVELEEKHEETVASGEPSALEAIVERAAAREVHAALESIPANLAQAVALHDLRDLKYREIAELQQVPIGTVMSRIHRGRGILARLLSDGE